MSFTEAFQGYGHQYGNNYGGIIRNKHFHWQYNETLSYFTITHNNTAVAWINMNNAVTHFVNAVPTTGSESSYAYIKFDGTNSRFDFRRVDTDSTDTLVCRIDATGLVESP